MSATRRVALKDVAAIERDIVEPSQIEAGTLFVGLENIASGGRFVNVRPVATGELASSKFAFTPRHVLYGKLRPYLAKIARPDFEGICSTDILPVLPEPELDRGYLAWLLLTPEMVALAASRATGANLPRLSPNALAEMKIPLPPLSEQRRIAAILDKADALRAKRRTALAQLDTLAQSIFLDMFGDPATNPKGWPVVSLKSKCTLAGEYGANVASKEFDPTLPRYVRITDVTEEGTLNDQPVSPAGNSDDWDAYELVPGDLLFARSGATVGKTYMHTDSNGRCVFAGYMIRFRPDRRELLPEYLFAFTRSAAYRAWVVVRQRVVAQPNINAKQYGNELLIPLPPIRLQEEFAARMADIERTKSSLRTSSVELDALFGALQHAAFRGDL